MQKADRCDFLIPGALWGLWDHKLQETEGERREIRYEATVMIQWKDGWLDKGGHSERVKRYGFDIYLKYFHCWVAYERWDVFSECSQVTDPQNLMVPLTDVRKTEGKTFQGKNQSFGFIHEFAIPMKLQSEVVKYVFGHFRLIPMGDIRATDKIGRFSSYSYYLLQWDWMSFPWERVQLEDGALQRPKV